MKYQLVLQFRADSIEDFDRLVAFETKLMDNLQGMATALVNCVEALGRVELPTNGLGNRCSIHLSYRALSLTHYPTAC